MDPLGKDHQGLMTIQQNTLCASEEGNANCDRQKNAFRFKAVSVRISEPMNMGHT